MRKTRIYLMTAIILILGGLIIWKLTLPPPAPRLFDGQQAYQDVLKQVGFGPRIPNSQAHAKAIAYIQDQLAQADWRSRIQATTWKGYPIQNIIAFGDSQTPQIILGAHYDSRILADQDVGPKKLWPVPGANDGASGVAVLLELARLLPAKGLSTWLVFFDEEDDGGIQGMDWIMGSRAFVSSLTFKPRAAIIVDMIGDKNLDIYIERNSNPSLVSQIWEQAARLGYQDQFINTAKYSMEDDHTPFLEAGIPAVDIIDFDYPYWHTVADTPDKVSPNSLQIVGRTLQAWLLSLK